MALNCMFPQSAKSFRLSTKVVASLFASAVCLTSVSLHAQMVPGIRFIAESKDLGLDRDHRLRDVTVQEIGCSVPANVLWPGDKANFKFRISNNAATPLASEAVFKVIQYGTRGKAGDIWEPLFYKIADCESVPVKLDVPAHGSVEITIEPKIPETFGGYIVILEIPNRGRAFAASAVRSIKPDGGALQFPAYALDLNGTSEEVARFFKRTGVKGARLEIHGFSEGDKDYAKKWAKVEQELKTLHENEITAMVTTGGGDFPNPLGRPRPHLTDDDATFKATKSDWSWLPSGDAEFEKWIAKVCGNYGWPKGPINAFELWNEPWEGISISGWGADMLRYREIYTAMAKGVEKARAESGTQVLIGGCGSSSNTVDKFFSDGSDTFLKWLDFCSIHYQVMSATPALMRDFLNRKGPNGPVRVWDTESWVANSEDRVGLVVASMHAMGQERAMGVYAGNVYEPQPVTLATGEKTTVVQAWSTAAAVGASTKFVGQRKFRELLFQNGLPWVFVFDGRPGESADDGTVVVAGDLSGCYARNLLLYRTVRGLNGAQRVSEIKAKIAALPTNASEADRKTLNTELEAASILDGGSMTISDGGGAFALTDFYGNRVASKDGKIIIPLNGYGYYLRTDGSHDSFAKLLEELRHGHIKGYEPVEIIPHDLTARIDAKPALRLTVTNILNRPVAGKLKARLGSTELESNGLDVNLAANETRDVEVPVTGVQAVANNAYPLHVELDAGADGKAEHDETIHVDVISKRSITVDGKLDDWKDVIPQTLAAAGIGANLTEKAWLPFSKFDDSTAQGLATGYLAYDDQNFYFAARVSDNTPDEGMLRFENRDDDQYFYPQVSYRLDESATFVKEDKPVEYTGAQDKLLQLPQGGGRSKTDWESLATTLAVNLDFPSTEYHQVAFYFLSWDMLGRHNVNVEISDAATGKVLHRQTFKDFGDGKYLVYNLAGKVRVKVSTNNWLKGILNGFFFDSSKETKHPNGAASAEFVRVDDKTRGEWKGVYGTDGFAIAGVPEKAPQYAHIAFSQEIKKQELKWPDGVRRFTYRKRADLPAGGPESHDNVQIAFNVVPADQKPWLQSPPGTPPRWMMYWDTDYEYAFNQVAPQYGGGTEIWRLQVPGMPRKHFYPRQPKSKFDGPVKNGKLVMRREGNTRIVEAALPWSEIPEVKKRLDAGQTIKFDFRVNDNHGPSFELATERSVSKANCVTFHNDWQTHWSNELEFSFEK